ncbi:MAG: sensor histidine kinase [Gemmatimonadales bacterium]
MEPPGVSRDEGPECVIAGALAARLRESREDLTKQWLDRINDRVSLLPNQIFPSAELLDHVPLLIDGIASYVESPSAEISTDAPVVAKAMELGALRHRQGFDAYEILKEYEILGGILFTFFIRAVDTIEGPCERADLMACSARLFRALTVIQQATMTDFLRLAGERIGERENRLRAFNQMVSHEIKNRIGAVLGASGMLQETAVADDERDRMVDIIARNAREMAKTVENILELSQLEKDARQHRHVGLAQAVKEAARQVREAARHANVEIRITGVPADVEVDASVVELCVTNFLSNAIKYSNRSRAGAFAEIGASVEVGESGTREVVVRVTDNGIGVPAEKRERLFERFFRAHEENAAIEGTGLGLSIVRDTAESHGGRTWAEFNETGSVFVLALPLRRKGDPDLPAAESLAAL